MTWNNSFPCEIKRISRRLPNEINVLDVNKCINCESPCCQLSWVCVSTPETSLPLCRCLCVHQYTYLRRCPPLNQFPRKLKALTGLKLLTVSKSWHVQALQHSYPNLGLYVASPDQIWACSDGERVEAATLVLVAQIWSCSKIYLDSCTMLYGFGFGSS